MVVARLSALLGNMAKACPTEFRSHRLRRLWRPGRLHVPCRCRPLREDARLTGELVAHDGQELLPLRQPDPHPRGKLRSGDGVV